MMIGSIVDPSRLFEQAFENLVPGGWIEIQDVCPPTSDDNTISMHIAFQSWIDYWVQALHKGG